MGGKGSGGARPGSGHKPSMDKMPKEENSKIIAFMKRLGELEPIDFADADAVWGRFEEYLDLCDECGMRPMVAACSAALGMDRRRLWEICCNGRKSVNGVELTAKSVDNYQKIYEFLEVALESAMVSEKGNPVKWIFFAKNHFNYRDQTERVTVNIDERRALPSADEVVEKYAKRLGKIPERLPEAELEAEYEVVEE